MEGGGLPIVVVGRLLRGTKESEEELLIWGGKKGKEGEWRMSARLTDAPLLDCDLSQKGRGERRSVWFSLRRKGKNRLPSSGVKLLRARIQENEEKKHTIGNLQKKKEKKKNHAYSPFGQRVIIPRRKSYRKKGYSKIRMGGGGEGTRA